MNRKKLIALLLCAALISALLSGCQKTVDDPDADSSSAVSSSQDKSEPTPAPSGTEINFAVLSGPTGVGAAKLMYDNEQGLTKNQYHITVASANDEIAALLTSGEVDIAAMSTNTACTLYNKTAGSVQMLAVNTLGVLYILDKSGSVYALSDLQGKTIYATGQGANPEYILNKLLSQAGLVPGENVTIEWLTAQEVTAQMLQDETGICMLPVPAATALMLSDETVRQALDLSLSWEEWVGGSLPMGCVVARTAFLEEHPEAVTAFLEEYSASIGYMSDPDNLLLDAADSPAQLAASYAITASAEIARAAIPRCNLTFLSGAQMQPAVWDYYLVLYQADPNSIGGSMPYDDLFYLP